jgi:hypothetical protein
MPVSIPGFHVSYRQAADLQPRPEITIQFMQRRRDLEGNDHDDPVQMLAGTTLLARIDGRVERVVTKPLPLSDETILDGLPTALAAVGRKYHETGRRRLSAIHEWMEDLESNDALSAWTTEPAISRLTFANLHSSEDDGGNE